MICKYHRYLNKIINKVTRISEQNFWEK